MSIEYDNQALASRGLPQSVPDRFDIDMRATRYGDQIVQPVGSPRHALADEGTYFLANHNNAGVPGTGMALFAAITAFAATTPFVVISNKDTSGNPAAKRIYLDYLKLINGAAIAGGVSLQFAVVIDYINRAVTNSTTLNPLNTNGDVANASVANVLTYNSVATMVLGAAGGTARTVGRCSIPTSLGSVGDEYLVKFGGEEAGSSAGLTAAKHATNGPGRYVGQMAPIIIGPGQVCSIHRWWLTEGGAATYELELGWWER